MRHGPSPSSVCSCSYRSAESSDAATYRGTSSSEISVTPAAETGMISTIRRTSWSRIDWMGKSVTIVRANSLSTSPSSLSVAIGPPGTTGRTATA